MQATGRTALTSSQEASTAGSRSLLRLVAVLVAVVGVAVDQVTKALASAHRPDGVHLVGSLLRLQLVHNAGAAFSTGTHFTIGLTCIAVVAAGVVLWFIARVGTPVWALALGLLLAGICGNLADRLFRPPGVGRGHVVDFIELPHYPVFNVADMCITVAAVLIILQGYRGIGVRGGRSRAESE